MPPFPTLSRVDLGEFYRKHADLEYQALMLLECGSGEKSYPSKRRVNNNFLLSCHHRHCPDCQSTRAMRWAARFRQLLDRQVTETQRLDSPTPTWVLITLPGVSTLPRQVKGEIDTILSLLVEARTKNFWGSTIRCALAILNLQPHPDVSQHSNVVPCVKIIALLTKPGVAHLNSGALLHALRKQWHRPPGLKPENTPTIVQVSVTNEQERSSASRLIERAIQYWYPRPASTANFLELVDQLNGAQQIHTWKLGRIFLKESVIQQDDLRYEREYTRSRIGEDLPTTISRLGNNSDIPWNQPIPPAIRDLTRVYY